MRIALFAVVLVVAASISQGQSTQPLSPTTRVSTPSIMGTVLRTVEAAQQKIRVHKTPEKPPRNTVERLSTTQPTDEVAALEKSLNGIRGRVTFWVKDVIPNDILAGAPVAAFQMREHGNLVVIGEYDNPSGVYLSDAQRHELQTLRKLHVGSVDTAKQSADAHKPKHEIYLVTDDISVREWSSGSTHTVAAEIMKATLQPRIGGYVQAVLVLRQIEDIPTTMPSGASPASPSTASDSSQGRPSD